MKSLYSVKQERMGGGCLAPKPNQGDLATQLIDQLHEGSATATRQQKYMQDGSSYRAEKQKIFKKAPLRKLVDYLSSHRHKLIDCFAHNLKVCLQKGQHSSWTTGLAILERLILMGVSGAALEKSAPKIEEVLRCKGQNSSCHDSEVLKGDMKTLKTETDKQNKSGYYSLQSNSGESVTAEIMSARFQAVLLDTANSCLEEPALYKECLRVLSDYLQVRPKCLHNEEKVHALLTTLMENLRTDYEPLSTLETYFRLLSKLKDKAVLSMCGELKMVIRMWIQYKQAISSSKSIGAINTYQSKIGWLELIIGRYLTSSLNGMQYSSMIKLLMEVQDELLFDISLEFESLYVYILSESDLGAHFLKALFLEFLRYGTMGSFNSHVFNEITENSRELLSSHAEVAYKNIKDKRSRASLYALLKRWLVQKKYIALREIISYHSTLFLYCFIQNSQEEPCRATSADILKEATAQHKIILIESVFELYQRKETSPYVRNLLYIFHKPLSDSLKEVTLKANISRFAIETTHLAFSESLQVYLALMDLYSKFDRGTTLLYMQQICELLGSMATFLHESEEDKEKLNGKLLAFIKFMISADAILLSVAFYSQVQRIIERKALKEEQERSLKKLMAGIKEVFEDNKIPYLSDDLTCYDDNESHSTNENNRLGEFSCYFKELVSAESKSKFASTSSEFQKPASVLRQQAEPQQESMQDILEMINY